MHLPYRLRSKLRTLFGTGSPTTLPPKWQEVVSGPLTGLQFCLPADQRPSSWVQKTLHGEYERGLLFELEGLAAHGGVLYDIGGHAGYFTCAWLRLGGHHVEVFEPAPDNASRLLETLSRNGMDARAQVHQLALAHFDGSATFIHNDTDIGLASMSYLEAQGGVPKINRQPTNKKITVPVMRLDSLVPQLDLRAPDIIKIDVEGAENHVLLGATQTLSQYSPVVFTELHAIASTLRVTRHLCELGFVPKSLESTCNGRPIFRWEKPSIPL